MKTGFTVMLCIITTFCLAQHQADNWYFGYNAGINFSSNPPASLLGGQIYTDEGCSSISDSTGNLLFYTDGKYVWSRNGIQMPSGNGLWGHSSSTQSALIVPFVGNSNNYFIITTPAYSSGLPLSYSVVDMNLNGGFGDVTLKNIPLLYNATEKLTAVRHSNGVDVWVICHKFLSNDFHAHLITAAGIDTIPIISSVGIIQDSSYQNKIGQLKVSPCGDKLLSAVSYANYIELFDFNNTTGVVTNPLLLGSGPAVPIKGVYGTEFSPDGSRCYASFTNPPIIIQWDLLAGSSAAIINSADTIGNSTSLFIGALQIGPDGRIYVARYQGSFVGCITYPNTLGSGCSYVDNYNYLAPNTCRMGLPNFITSNFCNLNVSTTNLNADDSIMSLYPNPASTSLTISLRASAAVSTRLTIINTLGADVYEQNIPAGTTETEVAIPVNHLSKGVYFVSLRNNDSVATKKLIVN